MKKGLSYRITLTAILIAIGLILPFFTAHAFGMPGTIFLPMHLPVFLIGFLCGPQYGAIGGIIIPVLSSLLTGMPPVFPILPIMAGELFVYGFLSGLLYKKLKLPLYPSLLIAMVFGKIIYGLLFAAIVPVNLGAVKAITGALVEGLPGIVIQLILIPIIVTAVNKFYNNENQPKSNPDCITLNYAKKMISENKASCVIIKNDSIIYSAKGPGVAPLIELYETKPDILKDAFVVDKVIGKAAAMITVLGGASKVYGVVMSTAAQTYLDKNNIPAEYGKSVDMISNRAGDGLCPLEMTVKDIEDANQAYPLLKETIRRLMKAV